MFVCFTSLRDKEKCLVCLEISLSCKIGTEKISSGITGCATFLCVADSMECL